MKIIDNQHELWDTVWFMVGKPGLHLQVLEICNVIFLILGVIEIELYGNR